MANPTSGYAPDYRVPFTKTFKLSRSNPEDTGGLEDKKSAKKRLKKLHKKLSKQQEKLYAQGKHSVLIVLQAMDTGGKDSTIRRVFGPLNPQGVRVASFKVPTPEEKAHDYLWRIHRQTPTRGMIRIFNRSHYEDVLVVRVHELASPSAIEQRYDQINAFERHLVENGTTILKFMLHISKTEQKDRLQRRLDRPDKHWKFDAGDLKERNRWNSYMEAFEIALSRCSTPFAPWYVIPANHKWSRDVMIADIVLETLKKLDLSYPPAPAGLKSITIPD